ARGAEGGIRGVGCDRLAVGTSTRRCRGELSQQTDPLDRRFRGRRRQRSFRAPRRAEAVGQHRTIRDHREQAWCRRPNRGRVRQEPAADGYTIMVAASGQMAIAAAIYPKLSYHPTRDFLPLTMIASFPLILAGPANDTIKSVKDLVAYGKANPDKSNYATSSPAFTITTELFKLKTGMPGVAVPYKSSNEMMLSVAGGNTLFSIADGPAGAGRHSGLILL